jgi:putative heme-binding domain-containing protein
MTMKKCNMKNENGKSQLEKRQLLRTLPMRALCIFYFFLCTFSFFPSPSFGQRDLKDIPLPDPELERKSFIVADGFEVNLFAADPKIAKPIQMNFDPQGRLWIVSSEIYPHIKPGQKANDKVLVLEDTDGDGVSDKTTVFADGLLIPTAIEPGDGGVYVGNSTELLHFSDTDGDGKADRKRVVLSGFGTEDTHHIIHTLRWGPQGLLYFNQSIYIHSHIETPYGVRRLNGGGIWQFRPETMQLEVFARGWVNAWGHHIDEFGQSFVTDGAGGDGINYAVPGAAYQTAVGVPRLLRGLNPGSPKHCGLEIASGRHLPDDWQGSLLTNDFRGHRVCRFVVTEDGSGYASREMPELIKTKHVAFRPIDIKMGPDGAIYIADWYNPIIQHGEVDFRDPRRDHTHGRIWRVTYKGRPLVKRPQLLTATTRQLLDQLKSPEGWTRQQAKRVLTERGQNERRIPEALFEKPVRKEVLPALSQWVAQLDPRDPLIERHRLEALWMYQALRDVQPKLLASLLRARDHRVRAAATRVLAAWHDKLLHPLDLLNRQAADEHPQVRLETARALGRIHNPRAVEIALSVLEQPMDRFLDYALWLTCRELEAQWLPLVQSGKQTFGGNVARLTFALRSVGGSGAVAPLVELLNSGKVAAKDEHNVLAVVAELGGPPQLQFVFERVMDEKSTAKQQVALLQRLALSSRRRKARPAGNVTPIGRLLQSKNAVLQTVAAECVGLWKVESLRGELAGIARTPTSDVKARRAALAAIAQIGGAESRTLLLELSGSPHPHAIRMPAVSALAAVDLQKAAARAVDVLATAREKDQPHILFAAFLQRKQGATVLAKALSGRKLPSDVAIIGLRQISASGRQHPQLGAALREAGEITTGPKILTPQQMQQMIARVKEQGDPLRGEKLFRRDDLTCLKCHAIAGAGGRVGPDLVSVGASAQIDYLIESLLVPNKAVKENYQTLVVVTEEGKVHTGIKLRETARDLVLRDAEDNELVVLRKSIEERANGSSIMPTGLIEKLTEGELVDLVRFMSELGKLGRFQVKGDRIVRRWGVMQSTPEARYRIRRTRHATAATDDPAFAWKSAYSTVAGLLPTASLPQVARNRVKPGSPGTAFINCALNVTTAGRCRLLINSTDGLTLWVNTTPTKLSRDIPLDLPKGKHRLTFAVDLSIRDTGLRVEVGDVPGSDAVVQVIGGK